MRVGDISGIVGEVDEHDEHDETDVEFDTALAPIANERSVAPDAADSPLSTGAAFGVLGFEGGWIWRSRRATRRGVDSVSPATWLGTLHVCAWLLGLTALTVVGRVFAPAFGIGSFVIALAVMIAVAAWWDRRAPPTRRE